MLRLDLFNDVVFTIYDVNVETRRVCYKSSLYGNLNMAADIDSIEDALELDANDLNKMHKAFLHSDTSNMIYYKLKYRCVL